MAAGGCGDGHSVGMRRMAYKAKAEFSPSLWHQDDPILLAVTREVPPALLTPRAGGTLLPLGSVKQLISSFAWDEEQGTAHWLLPETLAV